MNVENEPPVPSASIAGSSAERAQRLSERVQSLRMPEPQKSATPSRAAWALCAIFAATTALFAGLYFDASSAVSEEGSSASQANASTSRETSAAQPRPDGTSANTKVSSPPSGGTIASADSQKVVLESKGYIIAAHQILVSPKVSGMVTRLTIEEGKRVKKGDILAEVEDVEYRTDYQRTVASYDLARQQLLELERGNRPEEISQSRAQLQESQAQLDTLESDWKRVQELRKTRVATAADFDLAQSKYKAMQRQVERLKFALTLMETGPRQERIDAARATLHDAQANMEKCRWKLDNCKIRSPITGTILKKNAEEGNLVNAIAFSGSVSLCELADLSDLEVDLTVQERDVARVFKGQRCKVRAEAFPDRPYDGVVSRLMPIADRSKGAIPVRVKLSVPRAEEGVYLKPEMGAIVTFYGTPDSKAREPLAASLNEAGGG